MFVCLLRWFHAENVDILTMNKMESDSDVDNKQKLSVTINHNQTQIDSTFRFLSRIFCEKHKLITSVLHFGNGTLLAWPLLLSLPPSAIHLSVWRWKASSRLNYVLTADWPPMNVCDDVTNSVLYENRQQEETTMNDFYLK